MNYSSKSLIVATPQRPTSVQDTGTSRDTACRPTDGMNVVDVAQIHMDRLHVMPHIFGLTSYKSNLRISALKKDGV